MRRGTTLAMSAISLTVVGLGLRASARPADNQTTASVQPSRPTAPSRSQTSPRAPKATRTAPPPGRTPTGRATPVPGKTTGGPSSAPRTSSPAVPARLTVNGTLVDTPYGPVQVQLRIKAGRIVAAKALARPQGDSQTDSINSQAVPQLNQEVVQAQSGRIDTVSGATYTSTGYRTSLQAALDAAHQAGAL